jgi:hypothetical protein
MLYGLFTTIIGSAFFMLGKRNKKIFNGTQKMSEKIEGTE